MTDEEIRAITMAQTQRYLELLQSQDWDSWIDLWAEDSTLEFPFSASGRRNVFKGKDEILTYMSDTTESIVVDGVSSLKVHPMLDPNLVMAELVIDGHLIENDAKYNQIYVTVFEFEDGRIKHYREYWNPLVSIQAYGSVDRWLEVTDARLAPFNDQSPDSDHATTT